MKNKKTLLIVLCAALLVCATIVGTLAYLTDRDTVTNTFTVGDVQITLDEAKVNEKGEAVEPAERVTENNYHLIPGKTYDKDPTMTVEKGSEDAYARMRVTINKLAALDAIFAPEGADLTEIFLGTSEDWVYYGETETDDAITYEFRYKKIVEKSDADQELPALFTQIQMPGFVTGEQLATLYDNDALTITVVGDAIQAETFENADDAWAAFDAQYAASK